MSQSKLLAIKIDVDTERGTRIGVPNLLQLFKQLDIPATFLFSLGPDNTGRAIKRIFRPGFLNKVSRTNVIGVYGFRTLLNGVLWPGPHIGQCCETIMRRVEDVGHEVGIHCYDHIRWQDGLHSWSQEAVSKEFKKACDEFYRIFSRAPLTAGAAGWQANAYSLAAYDAANLLYGSDARGLFPCFPKVGEIQFKTLQIPTNLPTLDELLGRLEFPLETLDNYYLSLLRDDVVNVLTIHAELEGMQYLNFFESFLKKAQQQGIQFKTLQTVAQQYLANRDAIPVCELVQGVVNGRSGTLAVLG
ncbi:MAG: polysaccharide deacetylase family protein [Rickettsia endosymbiont of Ixodes persulcatus]|nr:polysaccharide deacetylase family protein [Rickettsia endosymbiont of Ixodes persulcatus]